VCEWLERLSIGPGNRSIEEECCVQVLVKLRGHYEKPSERRIREKAEAIRRARKLARKKLQREGLLPMKPRVIPGAPGRGGPARIPRF
jgi:ribosomal protein S21